MPACCTAGLSRSRSRGTHSSPSFSAPSGSSCRRRQPSTDPSSDLQNPRHPRGWEGGDEISACCRACQQARWQQQETTLASPSHPSMRAARFAPVAAVCHDEITSAGCCAMLSGPCRGIDGGNCRAQIRHTRQDSRPRRLFHANDVPAVLQPLSPARSRGGGP